MARPATSVRANRPPYSRGGPPRREARCLRVRACRRDLVRCPFPSTKEPFQRVFCCTVVYLQPAGNSDRPPIRYNAPFTTGVRGLCHGIQPCFLPVGADCLGVVVSHALLVVAIGVRSRSTDTTYASDATPQTLHRTQTLSGSRPQAPLRRL